MNKIFKVVWSKVKHCYVVVSEIAKNTTSGGDRRSRVRKGALAAALVTAFLSSSFAMPNSAWAADGDGALTPQVAKMEQYVAIAAKNSWGNYIDAPSNNYVKVSLPIYDTNGNLIAGATKEYWVLEGYENKLYVERQSLIASGSTGTFDAIKEIMGGLEPNSGVLATAQVVIQPLYYHDGSVHVL